MAAPPPLLVRLGARVGVVALVLAMLAGPAAACVPAASGGGHGETGHAPAPREAPETPPCHGGQEEEPSAPASKAPAAPDCAMVCCATGAPAPAPVAEVPVVEAEAVPAPLVVAVDAPAPVPTVAPTASPPPPALRRYAEVQRLLI